MAMQRCSKDHDIARMSSLKSAIELMGIYPDEFNQEDSKATTEIAIGIAEQFLSWIFKPGAASSDQPEERTNWHQLVMKECHQLQKKLGATLTDFDQDPCPWGDWHNGGAEELLDTLREKAKSNGKPRGKRPPRNGGGNGKPKGNGKGGKYNPRSIYEPGLGNGDYPISSKQFGYLCALHKEHDLEYDADELNALSSREASAMIDELQARE